MISENASLIASLTKMQLNLSISIVVHSYPSEELFKTVERLSKSIEFAKSSGALGRADLSIVSNTRKPLNKEALSKQLSFPGEIKLQNNQRNLGFAVGHNQATQGLVSDLHLILNPDAFLEEDAIYRGIMLMYSQPSIAMLGPRGVTNQGLPAFLAKRYPSVLVLLIRGLNWRRLNEIFTEALSSYEYRDLPDNKESNVVLLSGCCLLVRTDTLKKVRGFDERFFLYFEDFDLSLRVAGHGRVVNAPSMVVTHLGGNTSKKGLKSIAYFIVSGVKFFFKHGWKFV